MGELSPPLFFMHHADAQTSNTSTRLWFYYITTKIHPPFQNPGSAPGKSFQRLPNHLDNNEKSNFFKLKTSPSRNFVYNLQTFSRILSSSFLITILLQIQYENIFLPTSKHRQAKVRHFLGVCLYDCSIYRSNFVFQKCLET